MSPSELYPKAFYQASENVVAREIGDQEGISVL
jgi:hypothetical protein